MKPAMIDSHRQQSDFTRDSLVFRENRGVPGADFHPRAIGQGDETAFMLGAHFFY